MSVFTRGPHSTVLTDKDGYVLDSSTPIPVDPAESGTANYATGQIAVLSTVTAIVGVNATRRAVLVTNPDTTTTVYIGSAAVTTSTGQALLPGNSLSLPTTAAVYGRTTGSTITVSFIEVYD